MATLLLAKRGVVAVLLILAFVLQGTTSVLAGTTGSLSGTVLDSSTSQPIPGARITAASPSQTVTTTSDASGRYTFLSLTPDTYTITVAESEKYGALTLGGVTVIADQNQTVTLAQATKLKVIGTVTSRAASALVKPGTTADVYSIGAVQQDKASGVGGGGNLNSAWSAVATVPGVFVAPNQAGYIGAGPSISIRGGDYDQIGYELDGIPVNRAFDNYPSSAISSLGQQELQVYTGANPANSEAQGISGYINQVIKSGTYPATRNLDLGIGSPAFYNKVAFETGGATANRLFSYYVGLGGYNQDYRYADQFNGASLGQLAGIPLAPCNSDPTSSSYVPRSAAPSCYSPSGADYTNGGTTPAYALGPYNLGALSNVMDRDSIVNLHFGIPQRDGNKDDIQLMYENNHIGNSFYSSTNDQGGSALLGNIGTLGVPVYLDAYQYNGVLGQPLPANYQSQIANYMYPNSPTGRALFAPIPDNLRDGISNDQAIVKLQYQHNFGTNAFLRVYGYTYYSDWLQIGPQSAYFDYIGPSSPDYELSSHTRGVSATFSDQLNSQHLLTIQGNYTTSRSLRDNNTQMFNSGSSLGGRSIFAETVDSSNPYNGLCYTASGTPTTCDFGVANNLLGDPTTAALAANAVTLSQAAAGGIAPVSGTCGGGACEYLVVGNGQYATYNTVKPKFSSFSVTDQWKPNDRLSFNVGLRFDRFEFDGSDTYNSVARTFWYNAFNTDYCMTSDGGLIDKTVAYKNPSLNPATTPCTGAYSPITITNPTGIVTEAYNALQPRVGATFSLNQQTVLRASYGRYVEAPNSAFQQYDTLQADAPATLYNTYNFQRFGFTTPDHDIRPPVSNNYDLSIEHQFKGDVSVKLTPFLRKTQDQIQQFYLDQQTAFVSGLNVGKQTSQGFELEIDKGDFSRDGISGKLAFAYTDSYINYTKLPNGTTIIDPINSAISQYNAYTKGGGGSACYSAATATASGAAVPCTTPGAIANPYYNAPTQSLIDANANFPTFDTFPGGIGSSYQSYGAPYVLTAIVQWKKGPLAVTPALQFAAGQRYGAPLTTPGIAPDSCTASLGPAAGDPRYTYGSSGGNGYDASACGTLSGIPDPFTGQFDAIGAFRAPSQLLLHTQVSYDVTKRLTLVANFANIINRCFGGTQTGFAVNGACNYGIISPSGLAPIGNVYNPGYAIQPYLATPYEPTFAGLPFNMYVEARLKL
ncbi:MAG TPA: TonB-dependent receptor [Candidatus Limnocylindria bacterium]|nr:TonB-dependent receptor [Candidatus Limnocylindria bacterium]